MTSSADPYGLVTTDGTNAGGLTEPTFEIATNQGEIIMDNLVTAGILVGVIVVALLTVGLIFSRLYQRASKEISFVRTGFGGQKVIMNGGALVFPVLHEIIPVNMNTLRLEVRRSTDQALITQDRMRVDVLSEFYVRVQPTEESIAAAAQTLGMRTLEPESLKELVEGKFVDALRAVAAEMKMEDLHEQRVAFVQKVQTAVSEDLLKNGLELESVSLTGLDQTNREFFSPDNAFDAEGLTKLTLEIEDKRKKRNDIEQDTEVEIRRKNLAAEQQKLELAREEEYARLAQQREIAVRKAEEAAETAAKEAGRHKEAEEARIGADQSIRQREIESERVVTEDKLAMEQQVKEREIAKTRSVETTEVEKEKTVELAKQDQHIAIALKSKEQSEAEALADEARAVAKLAEEKVTTAQEAEIAERAKIVELIEARKKAERDAIAITVAAEAEKAAAEDQADSVRILANATAEKSKIEAEGEADAERALAQAAEVRYQVDAAGKEQINLAANQLSVEQIAMQIRMALIEAMPQIIAESVKPMEQIDAIKILQVDGLGATVPAGGGGNGTAVPSGGGNLADQVVDSALRYRGQAPLVDALLAELGLSADSLKGMTNSLGDPAAAGDRAATAAQVEHDGAE